VRELARTSRLPVISAHSDLAMAPWESKAHSNYNYLIPRVFLR
jgi:hypothetical protein